MGRHHRLVAPLVVVALVGCGDHRAGEPVDERVFTPPAHAATVLDERRQAARILDEHGACLPSDTIVAGVTLPRGLDPATGDEHRHVYTSHLPTTTLAAWFGPLLVTGAVNRMGDGVVYRDATVRGASGTHVDVSILPFGVSQVRVEIDERLPPPEHPMTEAQARQLLERPVD